MPISAKRLSLSFAALLFTVLIINSCKHKPQIADINSGYPEAVAKIFETKCISCHNSTNNLGSLNMETWDRLYDGGSHGAVVIPYDVENSSLLYYINTDSTLGPRATPLMPFEPNTAIPPNPLSREDYLTIRDWIAAGAPNKDGVVAFSDNADTRQKFYISEQGCDILTVVDAERKVVMRNIRIGNQPGIESSHNVKVTKDGKYAYVLFYSGLIQKIETRTDQIIESYKLKGTLWNVIHISDNDSMILASDLNGGQLAILTANPMKEIRPDPIQCTGAHGIAANAAFDTFYVTSQYGNTVWRVTRAGQVRELSMNGRKAVRGVPPNIATIDALDPHEIQMSPDYSKFFLTCEKSNEVRVMSTATGKQIDSISVPLKPQEMAISNVKPYLFVSCMEDSTAPLRKGKVVVIDYNTNKIVTTIAADFYQPHGLAVDDFRQLLMVVNRNATVGGPAPHHTSVCGGSNGWYNFFDINTFQPVPQSGRKFEILSDPYSVDVRFKK